MEASQITKLLQKQNTRTVHRSQTVDSSTLTWKQQIKSSTYVRGLHTTTPSGCCSTLDEGGIWHYERGGQGRHIVLQTGSSQHVLSPLAPATGSASHIYSSDQLLLQKAGKHACAIQTEMGVNPVALELPACFCENTNVPQENQTQPNPQTNPYLPPFDTYRRFKQPCDPVQDQNQKHFVSPCCANRT